MAKIFLSLILLNSNHEGEGDYIKYLALVKKLDPYIEEEVTIVIQGVEFIGFSFICPYKIETGYTYPVSLGFTILDKFKIREDFTKRKGIVRIESGYKYRILGILHEKWIEAGINFVDDDEYFVDYPELFGRYVEIQVDRISIEFLNPM